MKIKKGDQVQIVSGKDRGKTGAVLNAYPDTEKVVIDGLNLYKKRSRPKQQGKKGETVMVARPLPASNVMLVCKNCKKTTRVGYRFDGERKVRYCKKCSAEN